MNRASDISSSREDGAKPWYRRLVPTGSVLHRTILLLAIAAGLGFSSAHAIAQEAAPSEQQVKAAFVINFPKYVDWPDDAFAETNSSIIVGVLGESKLDGELQKMIGSKSINGRSLVFKRVVTDGEIAGCHVLFISAAQQQQTTDIFDRLKDASVLTVGESGDFLERGGIINLARRDRKFGLEVNLAAAGKARLKISSKLLNVAQVVKGRHE